jgi:hypothetical protein
MTLTEALERMNNDLRAAGYPSAIIEVHLPYADVLAAQNEEAVARAIIGESTTGLMQAVEENRHPRRPLGIVHNVFLYTHGS